MSLKPAAFVLNKRILSGTTPLQLSSSHQAPRQLRRSSRRAKKKEKRGAGGRLMRQKISFRVPNKKRGGFHKSALKKKKKNVSALQTKDQPFSSKVSLSTISSLFIFYFFWADPLPPPPSHPVSAQSYKMGRGFQQWSLELARGWVEG